jgi:hypothetical protein
VKAVPPAAAMPAMASAPMNLLVLRMTCPLPVR